jgi:carboxypeptidase C (cathepsin A)
MFLPAFANVAQFHGMLQGPLAASSEVARQAAEAFVVDDYVAALHLGARLDGTRRSRVAARIAELIGVPQTLVDAHNLRISDQTFFFDALRHRGRIVGRLDARVTGTMAASRTRQWEFDPGIESIVAPYTMAAMAYFRDQLGVTIEQRYEVLSEATHKAWNWNRGEAQGNSFTSTTPELARALRRNPNLRVFVASGRYDLGTPYSATDWSLAQLDVPAEVLTVASTTATTTPVT